MKILNVSQAQVPQAWLDSRVSKITGNKAGTLSSNITHKDVAKLSMADKARTEKGPKNTGRKTQTKQTR